MAFPVVDVSDWEALGPESTGSKPNLWVADAEGTQWLFKERTFNRAPGGVLYPKGDDWAEKLATEVAALLGVPAAHVEMARREGSAGTISRRVHGLDEQLSLGNEVLARWANEYPATHGRGIDQYTVATVAAALRALPALAPLESTVSDCVTVFAGYLVLDAVIGNTDRHDRNWAVIRGRDGSVRLSPTFDHASSLGFAISDDERDGRLRSTDRQFMPPGFARRARTPFAGQPHPRTIAIEGLREAG